MNQEHQIYAAHERAMEEDDELAADLESDLNDALWDFSPAGEDVFGARADKATRLAKKLAKLEKRLEKLEDKPEPRGMFARLRSRLRERRLMRLEKRIDKIRSKLEAAGGGDVDEFGAWPPSGYVPRGAHANIPRYQTIGQSAHMSNAALYAALSNPSVSVRSKVRIRQVLAERGATAPTTQIVRRVAPVRTVTRTVTRPAPYRPPVALRPVPTPRARYTPPGRGRFRTIPTFAPAPVFQPAVFQPAPVFRPARFRPAPAMVAPQPALILTPSAQRDARDRALHRSPHHRLSAPRIVCKRGGWRGGRR